MGQQYRENGGAEMLVLAEVKEVHAEYIVLYPCDRTLTAGQSITLGKSVLVGHLPRSGDLAVITSIRRHSKGWRALLGWAVGPDLSMAGANQNQ